MVDPERATRFWLAIAVATLWVLSVGGEADANIPASSFDPLPENHIARRRSRKTSFSRSARRHPFFVTKINYQGSMKVTVRKKIAGLLSVLMAQAF